MPLLDTLEVWFTRKAQPQPLSPSAERFVSSVRWLTKWLTPPLPDRDLKATDFCSFSVCLRCALAMVSRLSLLYSAFWIAGLIFIVLNLWHSYPWLFHAGRRQVHVWHSLSKSAGPMLVGQGFVLIPFVPLAWAFFSLAFWLLRAFLWNRRARRLISVGGTVSVQEIAELARLDASVWPPPL